MIFFHLCKTIVFFYFRFPTIIMDLLNTENRSKTLAFKKYQHPLYKYHPKFVKTFRKHPGKFGVRQFLVQLYDCVPNMKNVWSICRLLKNVKVLQVGTGKNPTTDYIVKQKK